MKRYHVQIPAEINVNIRRRRGLPTQFSRRSEFLKGRCVTGSRDGGDQKVGTAILLSYSTEKAVERALAHATA